MSEIASISAGVSAASASVSTTTVGTVNSAGVVGQTVGNNLDISG